jgi:hypothetical protein
MADCVAIEPHGYKKRRVMELAVQWLLLFFAAGFRASRALIQAMY